MNARLLLGLAGLGAGWLAVSPAFAAPVPDVAGSPAAYRTPTPHVRTLSNGLRVEVYPNARLGLVQIQLLIPAGAMAESTTQAGVANLTAGMLRQGTTSRDAKQFASEIENLGGSFSAAANRDYATVSAVFLARDFEAGLEIVSDAVINPIFSDAEFERARRQVAGALGAQLQNPAVLAEDEVWASVFQGHPYGRPIYGTIDDLIRSSRDQIRSFHRDRYRPDRSVLAIAGDLQPERAFALAEDRFGRWSGRTAADVRRPAPSMRGAGAVRLVDLPGAPTSEVRLALRGLSRTSDSLLAFSIANATLGGSLGSRLARDGRTALSPLRDGGLFVVSSTVPNDSVVSVVRRLRAALKHLADEPPSEAEIATAKRALIGLFPLALETYGGLLTQVLAAEYYGLPEDTFDRYADRVTAVSRADVAAATRSVLANAPAVIVLGPADRLKGPLAALGSVETVEPAGLPKVGAPTALEPPTAEQLRRGRTVVTASVTAHGGLVRLRGIKDSVVESDLAINMGGREITGLMSQTRREPEQLSYDTKMLTFESRQVLNGDHGWSEALSPDSSVVSDADSMQIVALRSTFWSDLHHVLLAASRPESGAALRGSEMIRGRPADLVDFKLPTGKPLRLVVDQESHRLVAIDAEPDGGVWHERRLLREYRIVGGIVWPNVEERLMDGERVSVTTGKRVVFNIGVEDLQFQRPVTPEQRPGR